MAIFDIHVSMEPTNRDFETQVAADDGREAVKAAMDRLVLDPGELIHMVHVSRPMKDSGVSKR